jgi:hypothetical protein
VADQASEIMGKWEDEIMGRSVNPVRNSSGALNPALRSGAPYGAEPGIILKSNPAAAAGPGSAQEGLLPRREGLWPGGSSGALFLTG